MNNKNVKAVYDFRYQQLCWWQKTSRHARKSSWNVYDALRLNRKAKYSWLADNLGVSECTIQRAIDDLKKLKYNDPEHSKIKGEWQLLK